MQQRSQRRKNSTSGRTEGKDGTCMHTRAAKAYLLHIRLLLHQNVKGQEEEGRRREGKEEERMKRKWIEKEQKAALKEVKSEETSQEG